MHPWCPPIRDATSGAGSPGYPFIIPCCRGKATPPGALAVPSKQFQLIGFGRSRCFRSGDISGCDGGLGAAPFPGAGARLWSVRYPFELKNRRQIDDLKNGIVYQLLGTQDETNGIIFNLNQDALSGSFAKFNTNQLHPQRCQHIAERFRERDLRDIDLLRKLRNVRRNGLDVPKWVVNDSSVVCEHGRVIGLNVDEPSRKPRIIMLFDVNARAKERSQQ
ncbi:MAG: hypothetical protein K6T68_04695 [Alicyclobacillus shizuokensis]|nr:hypothetical protein [Alicyclobacillus shizuokensis]